MKQPIEVQRFLDVRTHGFFRGAAIVPRVHLCDPEANMLSHLDELEKARAAGACLTICPELGLTGYSHEDLVRNSVLLKAALEALNKLMQATRTWNMIIAVGLPLVVRNSLHNVMVTFFCGKICGISSKGVLAEGGEFYENHYYAAATDEPQVTHVNLLGQKDIPFGWNLLFRPTAYPQAVIFHDICEGLWVPDALSDLAALAGATIITCPSGSNFAIDKPEYRKDLTRMSSAKNNAAVIYVSEGFGGGTDDLVFDGQIDIADRGVILKHKEQDFIEPMCVVVDIDLHSIIHDRMKQGSWRRKAAAQKLEFHDVPIEGPLGQLESKKYHSFMRYIDPYPAIPDDPNDRDKRCSEVLRIQMKGLAQTILDLPEDSRRAVVGISGKDSTLALIATVKTFDALDLPRKNVIALVMPGFGTPPEDTEKSLRLATALGVTVKEVGITEIDEFMWQKIGWEIDEESLVYENTQAWTRKFIEFIVSCWQKGIVINTSNLTEVRLRWSTFGGDHMGHYGVNGGIPKTLVIYVLQWAADVLFEHDAVVRKEIATIVGDPISPQLKKLKRGEVVQKSEVYPGPMDLHDFLSYHLTRFGANPLRIARMALQAFANEKRPYTLAEIKKYIGILIDRFFKGRFKSITIPKSPKIFHSDSPRGDFRMSSSARPTAWLKEVEQIPDKIEVSS